MKVINFSPKPPCMPSPASSHLQLLSLLPSPTSELGWVPAPAPRGMLYVFCGLQPHGELRLPRTCRVRNLGHLHAPLMKWRGAARDLETAALLWKGTAQKHSCSCPRDVAAGRDLQSPQAAHHPLPGLIYSRLACSLRWSDDPQRASSKGRCHPELFNAKLQKHQRVS